MTDSAERSRLLARLRQGISLLGLDVDAERCARLLDYLELLARWNGAYNLTAVRALPDMLSHHLLDSLSIAGFVQGSNLADLGSGAGLPGIPLAVLAPDREHVLIDSNGKKARFLREAVRVLGLSNVRVEQARVEQVQGQFDTVTARAFAGLSDMLRDGGRLLARGGIWLAMKGQARAAETAHLPDGFRIEASHPLRVPGLEAERHVIVVRRAN